jgi:hypothetical protein
VRLYVDLETLQLIEGPGFRNPVSSLRFKRGDAAQLEVIFLQDATTAVEIGDPASLELQFGITPRGRYDVGYLVHEAVWTLPAQGAENPSYLCSPSFNTVELDSAMQVGSSTGTELSEISLMGEITWREGVGDPTSTRTFAVVVENDVNRGTEGVPEDAEPAYPLPAAIELIVRKGVASGYAGLDGSGKVPVAQLPAPPDTVIHQAINEGFDVGYSADLNFGASGGSQDLVLIRFHSWIDSADYGDGISFQLLDGSMLAILDNPLECRLEGIDGSPSSSWIYDIWIDGAFDQYRPTAIWLEAKECPYGYDPYDPYSVYGMWNGSGIGTNDESGQINLAAVSGSLNPYGGYGGSFLINTEARYLRITNNAIYSQNGLSLRGVMSRIPTNQ